MALGRKDFLISNERDGILTGEIHKPIKVTIVPISKQHYEIRIDTRQGDMVVISMLSLRGMLVAAAQGTVGVKKGHKSGK